MFHRSGRGLRFVDASIGVSNAILTYHSQYLIITMGIGLVGIEAHRPSLSSSSSPIKRKPTDNMQAWTKSAIAS